MATYKRPKKKKIKQAKKNKAQQRTFILWTAIITAALLLITYLAFISSS